MNHHAPIQDYARYNAEMSKALPDKLFFLDHIEADIWVDFGCGDGSLLAEIPGGVTVGIDNDPHQRSLASQRSSLIHVFSSLSGIGQPRLPGLTTCAIFSSVLHEAPELLPQAVAFGFDYIVIRDMALLQRWRDKERDLNAAFKLPYWGTPSWDREVGEDYFQLSAELALLAPDGYRTIYFEHSAVPAIQDRIERDLGVRPEAPTHIKAIWRKA